MLNMAQREKVPVTAELCAFVHEAGRITGWFSKTVPFQAELKPQALKSLVLFHQQRVCLLRVARGTLPAPQSLQRLLSFRRTRLVPIHHPGQLQRVKLRGEVHATWNNKPTPGWTVTGQTAVFLLTEPSPLTCINNQKICASLKYLPKASYGLKEN